jgi:hypothetical protein
MRNQTTKASIDQFMRAVAQHAKSDCSVYFTGGVTAVMMDWRDSTVDIGLKFEPELDEVFRSLPELKESLEINIELAAPSDFIPELPGWRDRCQLITSIGKVSFYHYGPYSQALAKIERGHTQDVADVQSMLDDGLIERDKLASLFEEIEPNLYKYPAIDPAKFAKALSLTVSSSN